MGVDRTLLDDWTKWSRGFGVSNYMCMVMWDAFPPIGDDVRTPHYSMSRQVLKKLLRPGLEYKQVFDSIVKRKWNTYVAKNNIDLSRLSRHDEDEILQKMREFNGSEIRIAFRYLAIALQPDEVSIVFDSFD